MVIMINSYVHPKVFYMYFCDFRCNTIQFEREKSAPLNRLKWRQLKHVNLSVNYLGHFCHFISHNVAFVVFQCYFELVL